MDLGTRYLGLELRSPLVASASPLTGQPDGLRRLADAGAAAVVLPSLFEEELTHDALELDALWTGTSEHYAEALTYFPAVQDVNWEARAHLERIEAAKRAVGIPVIASLNGATPGGWVRHAARMQDAGADAIELNLYTVAADPTVGAADLESRQLELVAAVRDAVRVPLAVKLGPYYSAMANMAVRVAGAGADGLVLFNRFYQPDLDLETLEVAPRLVLSTSEELRLPLRWIAILAGQVPTSLAASTGVHTAEDAVKALLAGADVAMMTSALLRNGPEHLAVVETGLRDWLDEHGYQSVGQLRGQRSQRSIREAATWERANYITMLATYPDQVRTEAR